MRRLPVVLERNVDLTRAERASLLEGFVQHLNSRNIPTTCRKGCAHCCKHPFLVSILEGILLYRDLQASRRWTSDLRRRLEDHSKQTMSLTPEIWMLSEIPCPFLREDSSCSVYRGRPFSCRSLFSTGNPELCKSTRFSEMTPLVHRRDAFEAFRAKEERLLREAKLPQSYVPLSTAVLLGRLVCEEEDPDTQHELLKRFLESA